MSIAEILASMEYGPAPESPDHAVQWLDRHDRRFGLFINGTWQAPQSGEYFEVINPAAGTALASVAQAGQTDVDSAVGAARQAFKSWSRLPGHERARYLYAMAREVQRNARLFAVLESLDNGKPIRESRDLDIPLVARHFYYHAGWAQLMSRRLSDFEALGVVGQIIPWNFPLLMLAWKVAPALAMGNTVVLKPAEFTPLTALLFAEMADRIGLPPGVVNIVTGDGRTGELIVRHEGIDKIAFTGSTEVGRAIRRETAGSGKRLSLELGGKSPFVVFDDADLDSVIEGVVDAIWFNQGQVCCAGSRLLVQEGIEQPLIRKLRERMEKLRMGDPLDKGIDIGAIVAPVQLQKIERLVEQGIDEGATIWQPSWACPADGYFYPPTLFTDVSPAASIAQVEIFGPVLVSMTFRTPQEAVALANNTRYGLAASVWTENLNLAFDVAAKIKAGTVWINSTNMFDAASGFGGYRESGYGREGGQEGLYEYLKLRERKPRPAESRKPEAEGDLPAASPAAVDRTPKLFIGGRQVRPDSGYSREVHAADGALLAEIAEGNRKDIRNAVEAAQKAQLGWAAAGGHARAQILYYLAENLSLRHAELRDRIARSTGASRKAGCREVDAAIDRLFTYAAWSDKFDGQVHSPPFRGLTIAVNEPVGVIGIACPDASPLLSLVALLAPALSMGNAAVLIPSPMHPLSAIDLYQIIDTSDVPAGTVNIVTGSRNVLASVLAEHDDVDAVWYVGDPAGRRAVELASAGNMKRTWTRLEGEWVPGETEGEDEELLREATQVKNIWSPYGA